MESPINGDEIGVARRLPGELLPLLPPLFMFVKYT